MFTKYKVTALAIYLVLTGCGGGGSDESLLTGIFVDSAVEGLTYATATQSGVTNSAGEFDYLAGEQVTFSIGDLVFPQTTSKSVVTPLDLVGSTDINNSRVVNIIRLLQTLDVDGNPNNGITISDAAKSVATAVDFTLSVDEFSSSSAVTSLIFNASQEVPVSGLVSAEDAIEHFEAQLNSDSFLLAMDRTYIFNGEELRITDPVIEFDRGGNLQFNLKNNNLSPRHMVQVTTTYTSLQEFNDAFTNGELILAGDNISNQGMEIGGAINSGSRDSFFVTITPNQGGTYNFISSGTMVVTGTSTVTKVVALNIGL